MKQKSEEGSVSSPNAVLNSPRAADNFLIPVSSVLPYGAFSAGTDIDNREDRSSKFSPAASAPKSRYDVPRSSVNQDCYRMKNLTGRCMNSVAQRSKQSKGQVDASKKHRGGSVNIEKDNSLSSLDSDSRSYNPVFLTGTPSILYFGGQHGTMNGVGEHSSRAVSCEQQSVASDFDGNVRDVEDHIEDDSRSSWEVKEETRHSNRHPKECDPLFDSVLMLHSAQEALEREIQRFTDIGKDLHTFCDDSNKTALFSPSVGSGICKDHPSGSWDSEGTRRIGDSTKAEVMKVGTHMKTLEKQLEDTMVMLHERELMIVELEAAIDSCKSPEANLGSDTELQQNRNRDEAEVEGICKRKVEAEVQYLAAIKRIDYLKTVAKDKVKLHAALKTVAEEHTEMLRTIGDVVKKIKGQAQELETYSTGCSGSEDVSKMKKRAVKFSWCFLLELILLVLVLERLVLLLFPDSGVVIPT